MFNSVICLMLVVPDVETTVLPLRSSSFIELCGFLRDEAVGRDEVRDRERNLLLPFQIRAEREADAAARLATRVRPRVLARPRPGTSTSPTSTSRGTRCAMRSSEKGSTTSRARGRGADPRRARSRARRAASSTATSSRRTCSSSTAPRSRSGCSTSGSRCWTEGETLTAVGDVPGTLAYISPERLKGRTARPAGRRLVGRRRALGGARRAATRSAAARFLEIARADREGAPSLAPRPARPAEGASLSLVDRALVGRPAAPAGRGEAGGSARPRRAHS